MSVRLATITLSVALLVAACSDAIHRDVLAPTSPARSESGSGVSLITYTSMPTDAQVARVTSLGGTVVYRYANFPIVAANLPLGSETLIAADPAVVAVELDGAQYELYGSKQVMDYGVRLIEAPGAWAQGFAGQNVKIGIFDTGIDLEHPDLVVHGGVDVSGTGSLDDCHGHGTHVAGIAAAKNNGNHTVGVAPKAQLYAMRFFNCAGVSAGTAAMIAGLDWAVSNGMDVVNMSFGGVIGGVVASPLPTGFPNTAASTAFQRTHDAGVVLIAASGNSSTPYVSYPAAFPGVVAVGATDDTDMIASFSQTGTDQELTAPGVSNLASYPVGKGVNTALFVTTDSGRELEAIVLQLAGMTSTRGITKAAVFAGFGTVADFESVDCTGKIAVVSRGGPTFAQKVEAAMNDGCAGVVIHNHTPGNFNGTLGTATAPDGRAWIPAVSISLEEGLYVRDQIAARPTSLNLVNASGNLAVLSGTSMASPHAAGVAALILSKNPNLTPAQVRSILAASSVDLGTPGWDPVFGHGRINARKAVAQTP
ncbi:MAG: S8 family serine peptidase [Gemmatimonadaceae bacterium]